ncbi:PepSY domain-containing protein [Fulvimonas sp. R45]|uniref:PepSY domain-containing protein n=1 Tax=Fulvimonas sp. R45 TaxID=3045937 RepID=UPI00265F3714|nr:PepSY domain-containing protein [Fulvimonas sp. R45]MDO1528791.1 PepSY domain-containing protein [Fulvimonas sp. R45]
MRTAIAIALPLAFCSLAFVTHAGSPPPLAARAKIDLPHARKIALTACPGRVVKQELEKETGGSGLRYSFDIRSGKDTREVGVDAVTGKVLENSLDNNDAD